MRASGSVLVLVASALVAVEAQPVVTGARRVGQPVRIDFSGPPLAEDAASPDNPFLDYRASMTVSGPSGGTEVQLFFAGDGRAADTHATAGSTWRGYYVPAEAGSHTVVAAFRKGPGVAVGDDAGAGVSAGWFDGESTQFFVSTIDPSAPGHYARGVLRYVGGHHLRFDNGEYFLKGGANSPENVLGYFEFDDTFDLGGTATPSLVDGLHRFTPHAQHYGMHAFDAANLWNARTKGRNLLGALNYLASVGVDSVYFLTYNIDGGDGQEVWPWISPADKLHFDVSKLEQWERVFRHMDQLGIQLHVVTEEAENDHVLGSFLTVERRLYYRELVARFAHHNALQWNLGEESNHSATDERDFAAFLRGLDPYDHPITVHTDFNAALTKYASLYGDPGIEATSIQGNSTDYHSWALAIRAESAAAGRPWAVYGDEQSPFVDSPVGGVIGNLDLLRRTALWGNLMGGGAGVEWYFGYQDTFGDLESEDWALAEALWDDTRHALDFFRGYLPFQQMVPNDGLTSASDDFCFAKPGDTYAVYLPAGGTTSLTVQAGSYHVHWVDPRNGGPLETGSVAQISGPGQFSLGSPPHDSTADWAVLVWPCAAPAGSPALTLGRIDTVTARLAWTPPFGTLAYDVVRGDLGLLQASSGDFAVATEGCLSAATLATTVDDAATPQADGGFWYLVRPRACDPGSYDSPGGSLIAPRDAGIAASGNDCP